jgi:hypothetical protein
MSAKKFLVRVAQKSGAREFYRCGMRFTDEWREVEADAATAACLKADQMLEVGQAPGGQESEEVGGAPAPQGLTPAAPAAPAKKAKGAAKKPAVDS